MASYYYSGDSYYETDNLEYSGYDKNWVLGSQQTAAAPAPYGGRDLAYNYYYRNKFGPHNEFLAPLARRLTFPSRYQPQFSTLVPRRWQTYTDYPDEVQLKVETCCLECRNKMIDALRDCRGVVDVIVEGTVHTRVTVTGRDLKPKKLLKKVRKIIKATDYWSAWHYCDAGSSHHYVTRYSHRV